MRRQPLLGSWFIAGFEGSTHVRRDGHRLDLVAATGHDRLARHDYARMRRLGITAARESLRWHKVEQVRGRYDWSKEGWRITAAADAGITVAWDLCHFGWPTWTDPFDADFAEAFAAWANQAARLIGAHVDPPHWFAPINEISFLAWAGGEVGYLNPHGVGRGAALKRQLVRASLLAIDAVRAELPAARVLQPEPLIRVVPNDLSDPNERDLARRLTEAQFEAWDMLSGRLAPELGGSQAHLDVLGVNYYPGNQWTIQGQKLALGDPRRSSLSALLCDVHRRYNRTIVVAETGAEDELRLPWVTSVVGEVDVARGQGVPVGGICLYPILNHPGWDDDRHCRNGLWDYPGWFGRRAVHRPLARLIRSLEVTPR